MGRSKLAPMSTKRLGIACCVATGACAGVMALDACGANGSPSGFGPPVGTASSSGAAGSSGSSGSPMGSGTGSSGGGSGGGGGSFLTDGGVVNSGDGGGNAPPSALMGVVRDFRFYEAGNPMTDMDFENPPVNARGG